MTPAVKALKKTKIVYTLHEYAHDPGSKSYGAEAAEKLGVPSERVFKTLVVILADNRLAVGIIPVSSTLNMKHIARALGVKKAGMADARDVERSTGYVLGGVSPIGQKKKLTTIIDESALEFQTIYISAGRRGLEIELSPKDLVSVVGGSFSAICQKRDGK